MEKTTSILMSGASGLVGASLVRASIANQISVIRLVRGNQPENTGEIGWSPSRSPILSDKSTLEGFDAVIHLSGANLAAHRWTDAYKREIVESRVRTTQALSGLLAELEHPPRVFLCASATGIYGNRGDELLTEDSSTGTGFVAETCRAWEEATAPAKAAGIRVVYIRFGVVLSPGGGALARMLPLFRLGAGGKLGAGTQWMSWIALPDMVSAIFYLLETPELEGAINMTAPEPVTNSEFAHTLAKTLHRPAIFPAPAFALRLALGEIADEVLLASQRALPERLMQSGFRFEYPTLAPAFRGLL